MTTRRKLIRDQRNNRSNPPVNLAAWIERHPRVLERPIVVDDARGRAIIGRPPETVLQLIETRDE
jgi:arsenate reductase-like glutaredoxin family protein